jgi:hypothetical protein
VSWIIPWTYFTGKYFCCVPRLAKIFANRILITILYHFVFQERLRKLENERGALHVEVSILSEQVDAQSSKIQELESILQEKKDTLRQMEEALQKVQYPTIVYRYFRNM